MSPSPMDPPVASWLQQDAAVADWLQQHVWAVKQLRTGLPVTPSSMVGDVSFIQIR